MKRSQLILLVLSCVLAISVFMPVITIPFLGTVSYFRNGKGDGMIVLILAAIAAIMCFTKYAKWVLVPGVIALAIAGVFYINFNDNMGKLSAGANADSYGLVNAMTQTISLSYGFIIMVLSSAGLTFLPLWLSSREREI